MPIWKYKAKKIFPIDSLPERGYWLMWHVHAFAMQQRGIILPRDKSKVQVKLEIRYGDQKDFAEHGELEKEFKCTMCMEVETYVFKLRKAGEKRETRIHEVIVKEVSSDN